LTKVSIDTIIKVSIDTLILIYMKRPTHKELYNKIKAAKEAVSNNSVLIVNPDSIAADALDLDYLVEDLSEILASLLDEISPNDYAGQHPPERAYEAQIKERELFPFKWHSELFGCRIYFKITLIEDILWLVSLHRDR
jgi:hypothetical protein